MTDASATKPLRHKTLSAYYAHLEPLGVFVRDVGPSIVRETDPEEYKDLMTSTICASHTPTQFPPTLGAEVFGTQQEAIDRLLGELNRRGGSKRDDRDVLLSGSVVRDADLPVNTHRPSVETRHANSPSSLLRSLPWKILRVRLGDTAFRWVLLNTSMFIPVGNNCFLQMSGKPIHALYQHPRLHSTPSSTNGKRKADGEAGQKRSKKRRKKESTTQTLIPSQAQKRQDSSKDASKDTKSPAEVLIPRGRMFYGQPSRRKDGGIIHGLPPQHILCSLGRSKLHSASDESCLVLLAEIFPSMISYPSSSSSNRKSRLDVTQKFSLRGSHARLSSMLGMMREMLIRHAKTDYRAILWKCLQRCPRQEGELNPISHNQVQRYLTCIIRNAIGANILGSEHNLQALLRHVRRFVDMKQYEPVSLHSLMQELRVNDLAWIAVAGRVTPQEAIRRRQLLGELMKWIFASYLIPLLKNTFYITETASTRYETVYYAHEDWSKATGPHFDTLKQKLLQELNTHEAFFAERGPLGVSAVRLIPKPSGFRPIVNLGRRLKAKGEAGIAVLGGGAKPISANQALRGLHQVLTFEKERKRHLMGSSLFGTNEIFAPLRDLKQELLRKHTKILYFVKMDIKAAFDTIKQDKMLRIIDDLLDKDYCLMLYALLLPPASKASQGSARRLFKTKALVDDDAPHHDDDLAKAIAAPLRNAVIVDLMRRKQITRASCMDLLRVHIQENVWQIGDKFFKQKTGIPQGSNISSLLCSFFYACLEREHLGFIHQSGSRLLRYIDDFLFISDDYHLARRFVATMNAGFGLYGAFVSPDKTLLSFECPTGTHAPPVVYPQGNGEAWFPYCGFLIDMRALDMSMDYPRMISARNSSFLRPAGLAKSQAVQQSFALRNHRHRGGGFVGWLSRQLENRNHVGYLDTAHNDLHTVHENIFLNFALTAMKIPGYLAASTKRIQCHHRVVFQALVMSTEYTFVAGRARILHSARNNLGKDHFALKKRVFSFLALRAIALVLARKAGQFKAVHQLLTLHLSRREFRGLEERFASLIQACWTKVQDAKY